MSKAAPDPPSELTPQQRRELSLAILARADVRRVRWTYVYPTHSQRRMVWQNDGKSASHVTLGETNRISLLFSQHLFHPLQ